MTVFADYARYYNLLYRDKDYSAEAGFVLKTLAAPRCAPQRVLDLGCGTGRHALEMARLGVCVTGVDMSETMLRMGRQQYETVDTAMLAGPLPRLLPGDARTVRLGERFDAAVSLFHVMSYQNGEEDALAVFRTANEHLDVGGTFLFDFWYGQGVLRELSERREKIFEDDSVRIIRTATPEDRPAANVIVVRYTITVTDVRSGESSQLREAHSMRYWFLPELRHLAETAGFEVLREGGGLHDAPVQAEDWNAWMLVRKIRGCQPRA